MATAVKGIFTSEDLKALMKAKSVVFFYRQGRSYLNCIMDDDNRSKDYEIDCGLELSGSRDLGEIIHASHVVMHPQLDEEWQTILSALREGDEVTIKWRACNNNQYLNRAGLYKDEVYLVIRRTVRGRQKKFTYHVASSICENNTAKMVKHTSTPKSIIGDY